MRRALAWGMRRNVRTGQCAESGGCGEGRRAADVIERCHALKKVGKVGERREETKGTATRETR
jgi:hypothetical protein